MVAIRRATFGQRGFSPLQPPTGPVAINWSHPLSRDLVAAWLLTDRTELVSGQNLTLTSGASFASSPSGTKLTILANDDNAQYTPGLPGPYFGALAVVVTARFTSFANAYSTLFSRRTTDGTYYFDFHVKSNGKLACYIASNTSITSYDGSGITTLSLGQTYTFGLTYNGNTTGLAAYVNGVVDATSGSGGVYTPPPATSPTIIGADNANTGRSVVGQIGPVYAYNRALTTDEHVWHTRERYAMLQPVRRRLFYAPPAGVVVAQRRPFIRMVS